MSWGAMVEDLTGSIYEAAAVPTLWPELLDAVSSRVGGNGGFLFGVRDGYLSALASPQHAVGVRDFMDEGWSERDFGLRRALRLGHPGFLTDGDLLTEEEIATDDLYCNFYRPHGIGYRAGTIIEIPNGDSVAVVFARHQDNGPVPRETVALLDTMRPHLARAALLANRLGFERARAQAEALQAMGLPAAVLRETGRITAANALFQALIPAVAQDRRERVTLVSASADVLLRSALAEFRRPDALAGSASIPIPAQDDRPPMIVHLIPIHGAAHDVFRQSAMLLLITPVDRAAVPSAKVLQGLFDLTPSEARVAQAIGLAQSVEGLAMAQGVSRETVRSHLKMVLAKTGLSRQSELVSLLAGATLPRS